MIIGKSSMEDHSLEKMIAHFVIEKIWKRTLSGKVKTGFCSTINTHTLATTAISSLFLVNTKHWAANSHQKNSQNSMMSMLVSKNFSEKKTIFHLLVRLFQIPEVSSTIIYTFSLVSYQENISEKCSKIKGFLSQRTSSRWKL